MNRPPAVVAIMERIHTALLTLRCLPTDGPCSTFSTWPAYRHSWWDWGNELSMRSDSDIARRFLAPVQFVPTPRQVDDCLPALQLLNGIDKTSRIVLAMRAIQEWHGQEGGWRAIGRELGISHVHARRLHWHAMVRAWERSL